MGFEQVSALDTLASISVVLLAMALNFVLYSRVHTELVCYDELQASFVLRFFSVIGLFAAMVLVFRVDYASALRFLLAIAGAHMVSCLLLTIDSFGGQSTGRRRTQTRLTAKKATLE